MTKVEHKLSEAKLDVIVLESLTEDLCNQECAVVVTGIEPKLHPPDMIDLYFQSNKKSGGGDVDCIHYNDKADTAVITFCSHQGIVRYCKSGI